MKSKKAYADKFVGITSKDYTNLKERHKIVIELLSNELSSRNFRRILDIGCGDGRFSVLLGELCKTNEVYGVDISKKGVEMARLNGINAYRVDVDCEKLPFEDEYFDVILFLEVIEHLFNPDNILSEIYRTLKPGGLLLLSTPNLAAIHNRLLLLFGYQPPAIPVSLNKSTGHFIISAGGAAPDHIRFFTMRALKNLLESYNFKIIKIKGVCAELPENMKFLRVIRLIDSFISRFPSLSYRIAILCTK